jgi:muramoyltetrapeptide carboxypeptidase
MAEKRKPEALREGDLIGVVSPASPMVVERFERGIDYLKSKGYRVLLGSHVYDQHGYLAGRDRHRAQDLMQMVENPEVKAVFCSRGGYGIPRILDYLDFDVFARHPKIFVGYSDLTALQLALWKKARLVTFSGPMVAIELGDDVDPFTETSLWETLTDTENVSDWSDGSLAFLRPGKAAGPLLGGCLSVLVGLLGTDYLPDFSGAILLLEDVGEEPYRIDRYLAQLRMAGIFDRVAGVMLGQFLDCVPAADRPSLQLDEIFRDYLGDLPVPVVKGFPYGHGKRKRTVPLGIDVEIDSERRLVRPLESGVVPAGKRSRAK